MLRILLVEDDDDLRQAISDLLSRKYIVVEATNGKSGQEMLSHGHFDLVISDAQMPLMNGVEFLRWIKQQNKTIPFILMTGYSEMLETKTTFDLEVDNFIVKPFLNTDLMDAVNEVLQQSMTLHNIGKVKAV
jgi:CheY-like chemotaxis protein